MLNCTLIFDHIITNSLRRSRHTGTIDKETQWLCHCACARALHHTALRAGLSKVAPLGNFLPEQVILSVSLNPSQYTFRIMS